MSLLNLAERYLYDRLPQGLIELDERTIIWAVTSGFQDRIEDLRAYAKKFQLFFSPYQLPERGFNVVFADLQSDAGKVYTRSLDLATDTPPNGTAALTAWVAAQLNVAVESLSNVRYGVDVLRLVDANILDYLATNIGAVLYKSAVNENLPTLVTQTGTFTGQQMAHQRLIETYFPRLKLKGTAKSFEALAKLMGFDDLRMVPLWQRVSFRLPNDPGSSLNDADFSQVPEYYPQQNFGPFYNPLVQDDGPFYSWSGTAAPGTADTSFYTQVVNGFQPYVKVSVVGTANGTGAIEHPATGTYLLAGGAPHQKAYASAGALYFQALGEGSSWNDINVSVYAVAAGTLRGIGISDRLSAIKYRSSYFDLSLAIEPDRADATFGTLTARRNVDLAVAPHHYQSFVNTLTAVSPYRPFLGGTLQLDQTNFDFLAPFSGTVVAFVERTEAGLTDYQINYSDISKAAAQVTQALEEVRAATRFPRKTSVGWLLDDQVGYAPYVSCALIGSVSSGSITTQFTGSFSQAPLPPYTADVQFFNGTSTTTLAAESRVESPEKLFYRTVVGYGTVAGNVIFSGSGSNHYDFLATGTNFSSGTLSARFTVTSSEVVRPDAWVTAYGTGTWTYAVIGDYGLDITGVHENQRPTAAMVHSWNPAAIFTTGDNNYYTGLASEIARNNYSYWDDIRLGRFYPSLGNHDFTGGTATAVHETYFFNGTKPGDGHARYYSVRKGNVEWFCLNPGWSGAMVTAAIGDPYYATTLEPDGNSYDSVQGQWLKRKLKESTARWKVVYLHEGPYCSATVTNSYYPGYPRLRWPFKAWGADLVLSGHVHAYERIEIDSLNYITIGCSGESNRAYTSPVIPGSKYRYGIAGLFGYGALRLQATEDWLQVDFVTTSDGAVLDSVRLDYPRKYQDRPEDDISDLVYETADDYPWRRDLVGGGELVETDYYTAGTQVQEFSLLEQTTAVMDHTGVPYNVYVSSGTTGLRFMVEARAEPYQPAQRAIAFKGSFRDQARLGQNDTQLVKNPHDADNLRTSASRTDLDSVFNPGYSLYHAGLVQGVLVADPIGFYGEHHRKDLVGWLPLNEHPLDDLVVTDRAKTLADQVLFGIAWNDRKLDDNLGRYLEFRPGTSMIASADRQATESLSISFWIKCNAGASSDVSVAVKWGALRFELDYSALTLTGKIVDTSGTEQTLASTSIADWTFVYVRKESNSVAFGYGSLSAALTETSLSLAVQANDSSDPVWVTSSSAGQGFCLRDIRLWKRTKTQAEMNKVRDPSPVPTQVLYRIGHVLSANTGDRYGLRVLPTGWLIPEDMPAWVRTPKYAKVVRYDGRGQYDGESRFKEVGLGGGQVPPYRYTLGQVGYTLTAAGTVVVSTQHGALPGTNSLWASDATGAPGYYIALSGGSIASGSIAVSTASGSGANPWPNYMEATNPFQDRVWIKGLDGAVYEVSLQASGIGGVTWKAEPALYTGTVQQESGAISGLTKGPVCISVTTYGSVCQTTCTGTGTTPSLYLYLHDNLLENVGGQETLARWTDPTTFGLSVGVPALQAAGELSFTNSTTLEAGTYKLVLDGGNIGTVDAEFDGYKLDITVGDTVIQRTFLANYTGSNFRGQEEFEFVLENSIAGEWLLTFNWSNSASDALRGTARQLAIYGYQLKRLQTSLWQGTIASSGTTPGLNPLSISGQWTSTPGGWLAEYNSFGTVVTWAHEGTIYPRNDTLTSKYPVANLLTGVTANRREDVLVLADSVSPSPFFNLADVADPVIAAFGTAIGVST